MKIRLTFCFVFTAVFSAQAVLSRRYTMSSFMFNGEAGYAYHGCSDWFAGPNMTYILKGMHLSDIGLYLSYHQVLTEHKSVGGLMAGIGFTQLYDELNGWGFCSRVSWVGYGFKGQNDGRILAEAGISLAGIVNIYYGYGFHCKGQPISGIGPHQVTLSLNIGKNRSTLGLMYAINWEV